MSLLNTPNIDRRIEKTRFIAGTYVDLMAVVEKVSCFVEVT